MAAAVERRPRWAAGDISVAGDTLAAAAACVLAARLILAALRAWAAADRISAADRRDRDLAEDRPDRGLPADQGECDLRRGRVSVLSVRSHRPAQTGTLRSGEIARQQTSAEIETRV